MVITMREVRQVSILEKLKRKEIKQKVAADTLNCSIRTIKRRLRRYKERGITGLIHARRGKPGNRTTNPELRKKIMDLMRIKYGGWPPTHASQSLQELDKITIKPKTLRVWMMQEGLWKKQRKRRRQRRWRERKECFGLMVQLDGSRHQWISDEYWTLMKFVDDATSQIFMRFYKNESFESVVDLSIRYIKKFGMPQAIYTDRGGVYKVNNDNEDNQLITDYERSLNTLGIELIHARSPQAKGRVERSFQTDQQRLVRELKMHEITDMQEANEYLEKIYINNHNKKYSVFPRSSVDLHKPINAKLENIFVRSSQRRVGNDWTISYNSKLLQLDNSRPAIVKPKDIVTVNERFDCSLFVTIRKELVAFEEIKIKPQKQETLIEANPSFYQYKPPAAHPWRRFNYSSQRKGDISNVLKR